MAAGAAAHFLGCRACYGAAPPASRLLRQYFPKGTSLARYSPAQLAAVADELNGRPRKTLGWKTPAEALAEILDHDAALRALSNRLVGILHGCLKTRTLYDEATAWSHRVAIPAAA